MQRFAIMCRPHVAYGQYARSEFARENAGALLALRGAFSFLDSAQYRGISRWPLQAMLPPDSMHRRNLERAGIDFRVDARARVKLAELGVPAADSDPNKHFLLTRADAESVYQLLETPEAYEIVLLSRDASSIPEGLWGYDVGYWGSDFFSPLCDTVVAPRWHPADPADYAELAEQVRSLNEHLLFSRYEAADEFRRYYTAKAWAEQEFHPGAFCIIAIGAG